MSRAMKLWPLLLLLLALVLVSGWRQLTGDNLNPRFIDRIQDGKTTKNEILLWFGEPQEVKKTPTSLIYIYKSYVDTPALPYNPDKREINPQSYTPFLIDEDKNIVPKKEKTAGKILRSTLTIYLKPETQVVTGHEYVEHAGRRTP